jgi:hypothetical protein
MPSGTYEAGIQRTREGYIGGSLNEGAAIGEESNRVGWSFEPQEEIVETDVAVWGETVAHGVEVDWAMMLVDLDGVASAESDVRAAFSG